MLGEEINFNELAQLFDAHRDAPVWPGLNDACKAHAVAVSKAVGLWDRLDERVDPSLAIPALRWTTYRDFKRTGQRENGQQAMNQPVGRAVNCALALWLDHPAGNVDLLNDLLWSICDMWTWVMPAHERPPHRHIVELGSSRFALKLAEVNHLLKDRIDPEVHARVWEEIDRRIINPAVDFRQIDWWHSRRMNWNHVCNANLIGTAMYRLEDADQLAQFVHPLMLRLSYGIKGFSNDGGCLEGPSYWQYGFGHYVDAAVYLHQRTGGKVNLMADPHVERICRYPLVAFLSGDKQATFGDAHHGHLKAETVLKINHLLPLPELYNLCERREDGRLDVNSWTELTLYDGKHVTAPAMPNCGVVQDMGLVKLAAGEGDRRTTLAAIAGCNNVPHNHNDVGSFIVMRHDKLLLTDPGAPRYTAETFGAQRYVNNVFCKSIGHSVPLINGKEQPQGEQWRGELVVEGLDAPAGAARVARIDMTHAYDESTLSSLVRTLTMQADGTVELVDSYAFSESPTALQEAFVTFEAAVVADDRRSVMVGSEGAAVRLVADDGTAGTFSVEDLPDSIPQGRTGEMLRRITFEPAKLNKAMSLRFRVI